MNNKALVPAIRLELHVTASVRTWIGWLPFFACAARMRLTSPPIRPGSTMISLPSPWAQRHTVRYLREASHDSHDIRTESDTASDQAP